MPRTLRFVIAILLVATVDPVRSPMPLLVSAAAGAPPSGGSPAPARSQSQAQLRPASASSPDIPFPEYDSQAEQQLLDLANQSRSAAGAPELAMDAGLSQAARAHAQAMFASGQLSHQFEGELSLAERLASSTHRQLDQEAENVALDYDAVQGHEHLMLSPPHRANLLNAAYNVVGMAVIRSGDRMYIVQDFGHALPTYSVDEMKGKISAALAQARRTYNQPALARRELTAADAAACSMAQADKLGAGPIQQLVQRYTVLTYTSLHPEVLPESAGPTLASHNLRGFAVGACYARTQTYPTGVYWVVLALE
jgi:uncharacterized protein YkwD